MCHIQIQKTYTPITSSLGFTHTNSSMVNVTIYFTDMWVERIIEQWDYNIEEFVSDTGGSLNLFLGASFITLVQVSSLNHNDFIQKIKQLLRKISGILNNSCILDLQIADYSLAFVFHWIWNCIRNLFTLKNKIVKIEDPSNPASVKVAW